MLKRLNPITTIIVLNLLLGFSLLYLSVDHVTMMFHQTIYIEESFGILGIHFLILIAIRIITLFKKWRGASTDSVRPILVIVVAMVFSGYSYIGFFSNWMNNRIVCAEIRSKLKAKILFSNPMKNGTKGTKLTFEEYQEVRKMSFFPSISSSAKNINYTYWFDGFLPDYSFELQYDVPINFQIKEFAVESRDFTKHQTFRLQDGKKLVFYEEICR